MLPISLHTVCGLGELDDHRSRGVSHVLSILDPGWPEPEAFWAFDPHHRTTLHFHDVIEPGPGLILPEADHVRSILAFGEEIKHESGGAAGIHLLVHCHMGISRSTAALATLMAQRRPEQSEDDILAEIAALRPQAWPNSLMIGFADDLLGRNGRFTAALARHYARFLVARPEMAEVMRDHNRGREVAMAEAAAA